MLRRLLVLALVAAWVASGAEDQSSQQVLRCEVPQHEMDAFMAEKSRLKLDLWDLSKDHVVEVQVPHGTSLSSKFGCTVHIGNVGAAIARSRERQVGEDSESDWFDQYHRYDEIVDKLKQLESQYPSHIQLVSSIGKSHEGRDIPVVKLSPNIKLAHPHKIWINGGQHAREWASPAAVMTMVRDLAAHFAAAERDDSDLGESDQQLAQAFRGTEFHIAPVLNPDGYEHSHTTDRLWRKNRATNGDGTMGVDLNRNWPNHWGKGESGSSGDQDYPGPSAASEPEVKAVMAYQKKELPDADAGIDYHSYGSLILRSPGWRKGVDKDEKSLRRLGSAMADATKEATGKEYTSERAADLYPCTGAMDDWMSEQGKMWGHGWTVELPGDGHAFMLPESDIKETSQGAFKGLLGFMKQLKKEKLLRSAEVLGFADDAHFREEVLDLAAEY